MVWLIAWLLMMFTAVSAVAVSNSDIRPQIFLDPDGRITAGARRRFWHAIQMTAGVDDTKGVRVAPGFPGIVRSDDV
jgi:hypothetical protein